MNRRHYLFLLLIAPAFALAQNQGPWVGPDRPVYVVTRNHYAEGFTPDGRTAKFGDLIAIEIFNPKAANAAGDGVYNVGEHLALFMKGQRKGEVKVNKVMPLQCDSSAARVSAIPAMGMGQTKLFWK